MLRRGNRCCGRRRRWDRAAPIGDLGGAVALLLVATLVPAPGASASNTLTAPVVVELLRSGVALTGVRVEGDLRLGRAVLSHPLTCHDCHFGGDVIGARATFERPVDLDGSTFTGKVDLAGARLKRGLTAHGALFEGIVDLRGSQVTGRTDFSEGTFLAPVLAGGGPRAPHAATGDCADADFCGNVAFTLARFASLADFERTYFPKTVDFRLARFEGDAFFSQGEAGAATFTRATFRGSGDFSNFTFDSSVTFAGAEFDGPADFRVATFTGAARFDSARFARGATFLAATFPQGAGIDSFNGVESEGNLNFASATFARKADFEYMLVRGTLSFEDAVLSDAKWLFFRYASIGAFVMSVDSALIAVKHDGKPDERPEVLGLIESTAKTRGDLGQANDAHYAQQALKSADYSPPRRLLDLVFYRTIAGYFVRPLHPLLAILVPGGPGDGPPDGPPPRADVQASSRSRERRCSTARTPRSARALELLRRFGTALLETLVLIPPGGGKAAERQSRQIEVWTYRILFACALIGFANSNPTLRQMLDAVR